MKKVFTHEEINRYFLAHVKPIAGKENFFLVTKTILAFKKVFDASTGDECIANLRIPKGSVVYYDNTYSSAARGGGRNIATGSVLAGMFEKMRTTHAFVHSIAFQHSKKDCKRAASVHSSSFVYESKEYVVAKGAGFMDSNACSTGIHFFLTLAEALEY